MQPVTKQQIIAINTAISKKGLSDLKKSMINNATNGRTESSKELYFDEAHSLLQFLNADQDNKQASIDKMIRKLFAMSHEMGWITKKPVIGVGGKIEMKKDYTNLYEWVKKYGYLKKPLREYTQEELPKLLAVFENGPYKHHLSKA